MFYFCYVVYLGWGCYIACICCLGIWLFYAFFLLIWVAVVWVGLLACFVCVLLFALFLLFVFYCAVLWFAWYFAIVFFLV